MQLGSRFENILACAKALERNQISPALLRETGKPQIVHAIQTLSILLISTLADFCFLEFSEVTTRSCPKPRTVGFPPHIGRSLV